MPTPIYTIADRYVDDWAKLDPILATIRGVAADGSAMTDYSPDGHAARAALNRRTLGELAAAEAAGEADRIARDVMIERLEAQLALFDAGEHFAQLNIMLHCPVMAIRGAFETMPRQTEDHWRAIAARMHAMPAGLSGYRQTLAQGLEHGPSAAQRQASAVADTVGIWTGEQGARPYFAALLERFDGSGITSDALRADLAEASAAATGACGQLVAYLRQDYLPRATPTDGVGKERFQLQARFMNGCHVDLEETYAWAWDEYHRLRNDLNATLREIVPDGGVKEAIQALDSAASPASEGVEPYRAWLQDVHDRTIDALDGKHFEIPSQIKRIEVMVDPPGGSPAPHYTPPSEDFTRPGRTWWPGEDANRYAPWRALTTVFHEAVPGHHLQLGGLRCVNDVSRYQRVLASTSAYLEGWATYAEQLMLELGFFDDDPAARLGLLLMQAGGVFCVIADIGLHLGLRVPDTEALHTGEVLDYDSVVEFRLELGSPLERVQASTVRTLGWPGQHMTYKVGERRWLQARDAARRARGAQFDLKRFHTEALALGPMGFDQLQRELARTP